MPVDRAMVLRQQQLLDQAMQRAGDNPIEAERLSRSAIMQSGLEYMRRKQQEDIAKGGRARELALRKGSLDQRMRSEAERLDFQKEALAEGQKIRNIGLALNVASTLGGGALGAIGDKMKDPATKEVPSVGEEGTSARGRLMYDMLDRTGVGVQSETPLPAIRNPLDDQIMNLIGANMGVG